MFRLWRVLVIIPFAVLLAVACLFVFRGLMLSGGGPLQLVSQVGSGLTTFAMGVWVYQQTGSAAKFTTIALLSALPGLLLMPVAGALVDRWDKRWTMLLSDAICGLATLSMLLMTVSGRLTGRSYARRRSP